MAQKEFIGRQRLYHATCNVAAILQSRRMLPEPHWLFGGAIYFADSVESAERKSRYDGHTNPQTIIIVADLDLGVALVLENGSTGMDLAKLHNNYYCQSVKGRSNSSAKWEFVVYDPDVITVLGPLGADLPPPLPWQHGHGPHPHGPPGPHSHRHHGLTTTAIHMDHIRLSGHPTGHPKQTCNNT
jgi:hypothetical protein